MPLSAIPIGVKRDAVAMPPVVLLTPSKVSRKVATSGPGRSAI